MRLLGFSRTYRSLSATGSRCGCNKPKSAADSDARSRLRNEEEAKIVSTAPVPVKRARALHGLPNVRAQCRGGRYAIVHPPPAEDLMIYCGIFAQHAAVECLLTQSGNGIAREFGASLARTG